MRHDGLCFKKKYFLANSFISLFSIHKQWILSHLYTTALLCFPKNLIPWRDSNPGLLVPEADAMSTAPRRQGRSVHLLNKTETFLFTKKC
jgi:hypothetical protein